jgi:hypothetical protein
MFLTQYSPDGRRSIARNSFSGARPIVLQLTGVAQAKRVGRVTHAPATPRDCRPAIAAGVIFVEENGEGPGVRLRKTPQGTEGIGK